MNRPHGVLKLILLVSCAHALVHVLEQSVASVEEVIVSDLNLELLQSGAFGFAVRLPYGLGAFFAGMLADRFGGKRILVIYLIGAAFTALSFLLKGSADMLTAQMVILGSFLSMYHPAGLALLANNTTLADRPRALGIHGVCGSLGIASAPFIAGIVMSVRPGDWRSYFVMLAALAGALGVLIHFLMKPTTEVVDKPSENKPAINDDPELRWQPLPFALLVAGTALSGIVYAGVLHFLARYLSESGVIGELENLTGLSIPEEARGPYAAAIALVCGAAGQWTAGRIARPDRLPGLLVVVYLLNVPFLLLMWFATGWIRLPIASLWAFIHFMNQPIYNSLLPEFLPKHRRSVGFGFSNMLGFGCGAIGPLVMPWFDQIAGDYTVGYAALSVVGLLAALMPLPILARGRRQKA